MSAAGKRRHPDVERVGRFCAARDQIGLMLANFTTYFSKSAARPASSAIPEPRDELPPWHP
jgi:hypothetical protein